MKNNQPTQIKEKTTANTAQNFSAVKDFLKYNFRHFNSAVVIDAAQSYVDHLNNDGKMLITMGGAMSTAELGLTLAEMIRQKKVHAICCTGANLEEDIFNLVAHDSYLRIPQYRQLNPQQEAELREKGMNRVTDTCIPEDTAIRKIEKQILSLWQKADKEGKRYFPYEYMYQLIDSGLIANEYQIDPAHSWLVAACEQKLPIITPGWEDSTLGNIFVSHVITKDISNYHVVKSGLEQMAFVIDWYRQSSKNDSVGMFQIGGGISGDFPICVVPLIQQDLQEKCRYWGYFCQISDSTTSYGSYSGASPSEKITWGKLDTTTPNFIIESDATIVAPLIFAYVLAS